MRRFTRADPCPICEGYGSMPRGKEKRCHGYMSDDGKWAFCARISEGSHHESHSEAGPLYAHLLRDEPLINEESFTMNGLAPNVAPSLPSREVATYDYFDASGALAYQVVRLEPKSFRQRRPNGSPGSWVWSIAGVARQMYRAQQVRTSEGVIFLVEGEKDADALAQLGLQATTSSGGARGVKLSADAGKDLLRGRDVCIIADADAEGTVYAESWRAELEGVASSTRIVRLPQKDASDAIAAGATAGTFLEAWKNAAEAVPSYAIETLDPTTLAQDLGPVPWLLQPMRLAPGPVTLIAGEPGSGKTYGAQGIAVSVPTGHKVFGQWEAARGRAIHFDYEQGKRLTHARYNEIARGLGLDWRSLSVRDLRVEVMPTIFMSDLKDVDMWCRALDGYAFALIDSFRRCCRVDNENAPEAARPLEAFWRVSEKTGCTIAMTHHYNKGASAGASGGKKSDIERVAGNYAILGMCQDAWGVKRDQNKVDAPSIWTHIRSRFPGSREESFQLAGVWSLSGALEFKMKPLGKAEEDNRRERMQAERANLLLCVRDNRGQSGRTLAKLLGRSKSSVADDLAELENLNAVKSVPGPRNGKLWFAV